MIPSLRALFPRFLIAGVVISVCSTFSPLLAANIDKTDIELPLTRTQPMLSKYCFHAVREEFGEWETPRIRDFEEQRKLCINQLLAAQGDAKARSALEKTTPPMHDYSVAAKKLMKLARESDVPTLSKLFLTTKDIPANEYLAELYKSLGIMPADQRRFPVRQFDEYTAPMAASTFARWLDNDTVIYPATLYAGTPGPKRSIVSLNVNTLHREIDLPEDTLEKAKPPQLAYRQDGCQILGGDGVVCRKILQPPKESTREDGITERICAEIDQNVAVFTTPQGEFEYDFKTPVNIDFRYDAFSQEYWLTANTKVWRFSKDLKPLSIEEYPKGFWGNIACGMSSGFRVCKSAQQIFNPCNIFEYSTKAGFLVPGRISINDRDNLDKTLINIKSLFLIMKDRTTIEILPEFDNILSHVSVSPDGCKAAFVSGDKLGVIELCGAKGSE